MYKLKFQKILLNFKLISFLLFKKKNRGSIFSPRIYTKKIPIGWTDKEFVTYWQLRNELSCHYQFSTKLDDIVLYNP
jgi:hypothetical protein